MKAEIAIASAELSAGTVDELARELVDALNRETDATAELPTAPSTPGGKGSALEIGKVLVDVLSTGAASGMLDVLKSFFQREKSLVMTVKTAKGEITITGQNMSGSEQRRTLEAAQRFLGVSDVAGTSRGPNRK